MSSDPSSDHEYLAASDDWTDEVDDDDDELDLEEMIRLGGADMLDELEDEDDDDDYIDEDDDEEDEEGLRVYLEEDGEGEDGMENLVLSEEAVRVLSAMAGSGGSTSSLLQQIRLLTAQSRGGRGQRAPPEQPSHPSGLWIPPAEEAAPEGLRLRYGGEFGSVKRKIGSGLIWERERGGKWGRKADYGKECVPNTDGTVVANLTAPPYCGQYSSSSDFFYTATKDFRMSLFSTSAAPTIHRPPLGPVPPRRRFYNAFGQMESDSWDSPSGGRVGESSLPVIKSFQGPEGGWTVTDADLANSDEWMIYSSMTPEVQLFRTRDAAEDLVTLDFSSRATGRGGRRYHDSDHLRLFSVRFSADGKEIVGGGSAGYGEGKIIVFDIDGDRPTLSIDAHKNDVNAVCWADEASKHVLCSASDDGYVKVWDRRSLSSGKPSGVLVGHTEGITSVSAKGDGRYILSNGKDQSCRLWDLRSMASSSVCDSVPDAAERWGTGFDYRQEIYSKPRYQKAAGDCSVMVYRGHSVVRTLIRCHFAPENLTGQQYIYSGSADGRVHVWNLDGRIAQVLDRRHSAPLIDLSSPTATPDQALYSDPSAPDQPSSASRAQPGGRRRGMEYCVRDVSWHGYKPEMISAAWDPNGRGSLAKHEWKGMGKHAMTIEDVNARESQERNDF